MLTSEIVELLEELRDNAIDELKEMHAKKLSCNSYGAGYEDGVVGTCQYLLDRINGIIDE